MIIGIISDIHQNSSKDIEVLDVALKNILNHGAVGLLMAGDIGDNHKVRVAAFDNIIDNFPNKYRKNLALMLGNHDVRTGVRPDGSLDPDLIELYHSYLEKCHIPYDNGTMCIDVCIEGYHFLCLNTDVGLKDQMELNNKSISWLKEKLSEKAEPNKPIFIMTHQPFNSSHWRAGLFGGFGPQDQELKDIFLNYPQIVMLNGHIHNGFGVIECIQRAYGTLVEIPSLTRGENGINKNGTGYLLKIFDTKLVFEAWDFEENTHFPEYDSIIYLPTLSVLSNSLSGDNDDEVNLLVESNDLMNKSYINDIPDGDNTRLPQESYGVNKIYVKETWDKINTLREKIILLEEKDENKYHDLEFEDQGVITEQMLTDALNQHNYIHINLSDGHWVKDITIPQANKKNQRIKIKSSAGYNCTIKTPSEEIVISRGDEFISFSKIEWDVLSSGK